MNKLTFNKLANYMHRVTQPTMDDAECMAEELIELRTMIANHWKHSYEEGWENIVTYCGYCGHRQHGDEDRHSPDCLVVRYKEYKAQRKG